MGTLSLVLEYLKDLEECIDDGDSRIAKEAKLFDALEHKSVVIEVNNQKIAIFTKAPLRAFGEPFMRYSLPCKVDGQGAWDAELDLADSANYVTEKVLENMGFVHASLSNYGRKMVNDVNVEIHEVKFKADFVVLDYVNEGEPSILFGRDFLATTKSQVDFGLGEIRMNLTKFKEGIDVIDLLEEVGSSKDDWLGSFEVIRDEDRNMKGQGFDPHPQKAGGPFLPLVEPEAASLPLVGVGLSTSQPPPYTVEDGIGTHNPWKTVLGVTFLEDDMERALAVEAYFNPFKNVIVFKKLVDFLGSLPVQLKNLDWGNKGYGTYKKVDGDRNWHTRFEIVNA
ncbi:hypothetical protein Tco_0783546 [Tanacetum coccineum]